MTEEDRHWWFASRTRALLGMLDRAVPPGKLLVLDVGCGAGNMIHHLSRYGQVVGMDNFLKPLLICRGRGYQAQLGDAAHLPYADSSFDLVAVLDVIEHCDDDQLALSECQRVLRPGGLLVLTVPAFPWLWSHNDEINRHRRRYTGGELKRKLSQAGSRVRRLAYNNFFIFPLAAGLILARKILGRKPALAAPVTDEEAYQVEMEPVAPALNMALAGIGRLEAALLRFLDLPFGTSIICIAEKTGAAPPH
ncbi:MAG: class I SAM-dependent methyltransferase [Chloroflexota bacterium]